MTNNHPPPAIRVDHISKTYLGLDIDHKVSGVALWLSNITRLTGNRAEPTRALHDITFDVARGEILGIYGANGAGKTTLIKILSGLLVASEGRVEVDGRTDPQAIKDAISYVSTNGWMGLEWQLTARENLLLYGYLFGLGGKMLDVRITDALARLDLAADADKRISELSAGMRQKLTLARGLILRRPILYLDEPTVSLDVQTKRQVREVARDVARQEGVTVLITSHNPEDLSICDRILFLHRGERVGLGTPESLARPLAGIQALHLELAQGAAPRDAAPGAPRPGAAIDLDVLRTQMLALPGVRDAHLEIANGRRDNRVMRLVLKKSADLTSRIVDACIAANAPIVGMRTTPVTLNEVYEHHVRRHAHVSAQ